MNFSPNSLKFIDKITPWFPTMAKIISPMAATIPIRTYFAVSAGGVTFSLGALYKINLTYFVIN